MPVMKSKAPIGCTSDAGGERDVRLVAHDVNDFFRHVADERADEGAVRRADHDVRASAARALGNVAQHAVADADQRQNHGDLNADGEWR